MGDIKQIANINRERKNLLQQTFRMKKLDEKGNKLSLPPQYKNKDVWLEVTDYDMFIKIFPDYLHHIANEMSEWWIFVKKTNPILATIEELKIKSEKILKVYSDKLLIHQAKYNTGKLLNFQIDVYNMSYYHLVDICNSLKLDITEKTLNKE